MWGEAAKAMAEFSGAVVTAMDADGYPVSVRVAAPRYDAQTGRLPVVWPSDFAVTAGPANVLCHYHDEGLWSIRALQIKGRLERCSEDWTFISTDFKPILAAAFETALDLQRPDAPEPFVVVDQ